MIYSYDKILALCALETIMSSTYSEDNQLVPALMTQTLSLKV